MRRPVIALSAVALLASGVVAATTASAVPAAAPACTPRTLVLSAMPLELGPLLTATAVTKTVTVQHRDFYVGTLHGRPVVLAQTGIGPVNATRTTKAALATFTCGRRSAIDAVVFSGVAGGDYIGDVVIPTRWTLDAGKHLLGVDPTLLATARKVARRHPALQRTNPVGDPACGCVLNPDTVATVTVTHSPVVEVGGSGQTTDPADGKAIPCVPGGGDIAGCSPCVTQANVVDHAQGLAAGVPPFVDPSFLTGYAAPVEDSSHYVVEDEETAAVDAVATAAHARFLGIRGVSDGGGDPIGLPGFPVQFFYYRQLAADNAARVTLAILAAWPGH